MPASHVQHHIRTNEDVRALRLSIYTLAKLADALNCVDPTLAMTDRMTNPAFAGRWQGLLTVDALGNFVSFE